MKDEGYVTTADGVRLFYQTAGDGRETLIVPNGIIYRNDFAPLAIDRTIIFFDVRNRGRSDAVADEANLARGIFNDVDDIDAVRRHFERERIDVLGHSYQGVTVVLAAQRFPRHIRRVVQIGPMSPSGKQYPLDSSDPDDTRTRVLSQLELFRTNRPTGTPEEICRRFWAILAPIYVVDPANAHRVDGWGRCDLANERNALNYLTRWVFPSIAALPATAEQFADCAAPVLTIHGRADRSAPFGGGEDWASRLPNARLLAVEHAGHAAWVEQPAEVFAAINSFLSEPWT